MKRCFILLAIFTASLCVQAQNQRAIIDQVIAAVDSFSQKESPDTSLSASPFSSNSDETLSQRQAFYNAQLQKLNEINIEQLSLKDRIDVELMRYRLQGQVDYYAFKEYLNPILSDNGFHTGLPFDAARQYSTAKEYRRYINRLKHFGEYSKEQMDLIRKGLAMGLSQPVVALTGYESTYNTHITDTVERSVFYQPFSKKPMTIDAAEWEKIVAEGKQAISEVVIPAYRSIKKFFETEYYPRARKTLGISETPDGKAHYVALVKHHTTTDLSPDSIYNIGMQEVNRIRKEMEAVIKEVGFKGSFSEFFTFLRTDPRFFVTTPEQLLKEAAYIAKKIDGKLPSLFGKLPRQPYGVLPVPDYLAPSYTTGRYSGTPIGGKNSGSYWVNTYNLKSRTLYTLEALTLHEAVPGHHLQTALAQELAGSFPKYRQGLYVNAFGEGWGLYSEYLGTELGLYKDPYSKFGRLTYEMWRACRLVIDVGIHAKKWTREQAVRFLADNSALSLHEVNTEVNRYITWPGQALAYKIGELKIIQLRRKAEAALKDKFDVRAFHDLVLSQGSVTLSILELMVNDWIDQQLKK